MMMVMIMMMMMMIVSLKESMNQYSILWEFSRKAESHKFNSIPISALCVCGGKKLKEIS